MALIMRTSSSLLILSGLLHLCTPASAQVTTRASLNSSGVQGVSASQAGPISSDGRFVVLNSDSTNLVPGDTNGALDVFVRDRVLGTTERVSLSEVGAQTFLPSYSTAISDDGRFVVFVSEDDLVYVDVNGFSDVFVRDRQLGTTTCVSLTPTGAIGNGPSEYPACSPDGRFVAFRSAASDLVSGDTNGFPDIFVRDRQSLTTECASLAWNGAQSNSYSFEWSAISADGRFVAFSSTATNLVPGDTNNQCDVFVRDLQLGTTLRASVDSSGLEGNDDSEGQVGISSDGRFVCFESLASNLVAGDTNSNRDVFVHDFLTGATERVDVDSSGGQANGFCYHARMSLDGRFVAFDGTSTNLVPGDTNNGWDVFVHDRATGTTERASLDSAGGQGIGQSSGAWISAGGRFVTFTSAVTTFVPGDTNGTWDVFVRDRAASGFASLCDPGAGGVVPCPCGNPPGAPGRGCDNSSATGGASISASGAAYLSIDSLVFTTTGERPTAPSILVQGSSGSATGIPFGQGVRCAAGQLKRMYLKIASGGSISAPQFGAGDLTVSARSLALGDAIQPGESRWYLVYYRDPLVLGGCPASAGFNCTQTGQVTWWP